MRFLFIQGYSYSFPLSSQKVKSVLANSIRERPLRLKNHKKFHWLKARELQSSLSCC